MSDQPSNETGLEFDASEDKLLTDSLTVPPWDEGCFGRMRAAVAEEWLAATSASRYRPRPIGWGPQLGMVAVSLVILIVGINASRPSSDSATIGTLTRLNDGGVSVRTGLFRHRALQLGDSLHVGDTLTTRGLTLVTLAQGGTLRIGAGTTISVTRPMQLSLKSGLIYVDMPPGLTASNLLSIKTRAGAIEHIGTEYEVMSDQRIVRIRVREGRIRISGASAVWVADAGTELLATLGDQFSQRPFATFGRDWLWIEAISPDYEIEGQLLTGFLGWVSREVGRPLEFSDARARQVANSTVLHGSVRGQEPLEALTHVLASTSLTYELRGDRIWVHSDI